MVTISRLAETAALVGDPARAAILYTLMDGRAFTAGELARAAGIGAPSASPHLARLLEAGMIAVEPQGRHRYFRITSAEIGAMIEGLMVVTAHRMRPMIVPGPRDAAMRRARMCYDHIAGALGVALFDALVGQNHLALGADGPELTESGCQLFHNLSIEPRPTRCRACLDWSERRHHLAGSAGSGLARAALDRGWVRRAGGGRALSTTPAGAAAFHTHFGVTV